MIKKNLGASIREMQCTGYLNSQLFFNRAELDCFVSQEVPLAGERRKREDAEKCLWHREIEEKQLKAPVSLLFSLSSAWPSGS
jgi:hypothetical protein